MNQRLSTLTKLADKYCCDKGRKKHRYTETYHSYFKDYIDDSLNLLELGVATGASIRMWLSYFSKAMIYGVDIVDEHYITHPRFKFILCNTEYLILDKIKFKIIIDDASHTHDNIIDSLHGLWGNLLNDGYYFIEDIDHPKLNAVKIIEKIKKLCKNNRVAILRNKLIIIKKCGELCY